ncbi:unnamed protein product [Caenorhabditis angaria]|uniref:Uncharacterized protein n=1 Tax=Caenorhabditis angaria TaxID=860376 RepID=A0A9P1II26_9PELO|nr:unnamed protein product [Caenorhabditis angaria]
MSTSLPVATSSPPSPPQIPQSAQNPSSFPTPFPHFGYLFAAGNPMANPFLAAAAATQPATPAAVAAAAAAAAAAQQQHQNRFKIKRHRQRVDAGEPRNTYQVCKRGIFNLTPKY